MRSRKPAVRRTAIRVLIWKASIFGDSAIAAGMCQRTERLLYHRALITSVEGGAGSISKLAVEILMRSMRVNPPRSSVCHLKPLRIIRSIIFSRRSQSRFTARSGAESREKSQRVLTMDRPEILRAEHTTIFQPFHVFRKGTSRVIGPKHNLRRAYYLG